MTRKGIGFEALDYGLLSCENPARLQELCNSLDSEKIDAVFRKRLARFPHPFRPEERAAGYRYELSILQVKVAELLNQDPSIYSPGRMTHNLRRLR